MRKPLLPLLAGLTGLLATAAFAHDFFLLPESFHSSSAGPVTVRATVGSSFPTPEIVVTPDRAERTWVKGAGQPQLHIVGPDEKSLVTQVVGARPGLVVAAMKTKPRDVEYGEDRIPLILDEYRVAPEAAAAVERLQRPRTWKVVSRRFAKTLLCIQQCGGQAVARQPIDGTLEFVTYADLKLGHFILLASGRPLANYPVDLVDSDGKKQHLQTDASGRIFVPASAKGPLMLFAALLTPPQGAERFTLDLTSLTFSRGEGQSQGTKPERG